jgi:outer membrane receptor for ferrienterochelin and colicins
MLSTLLIAGAALAAQHETAACAIGGTVTDPSGAALPGAIVSVRPGDREVVTGPDGGYCVTVPAPGGYDVLVRFPGFAPVAFRAAFDGSPVSHHLTMHPARSEDVVVTATRTMRLAESVPVRTEVIGSEAIRASAARTLADAVEYTTGVRVENNCQNCNFSQIRLLGLEGPYTQVLVDSQPVMSALAQVYGIEQIPARMIDRIEVVKGGGSALYGAGAVGGVVNIISREPAETGGTFEARYENGGAAGGVGDWVSRDKTTFLTGFGQWDQVAARDVNRDGFSDVSRRRLSAGGFRLRRYALDGRGTLTLDASRIDEARRGGDSLDLPPHDALIAESIESRRTSASASWTHALNHRLDYRVTVASALTDRDSYYGTGRDPNAYGRTASRLFVADGQVNVYAGTHILSSGVQMSRDRLTDAQPAYERSLDDTYTSRGLLLQDDWTIRPGMQLLTGVRADWHSALNRPVWSPRAALMISPRESVDVRLSLARGFRAPQVFDEDLHLSSVGGQVRLIRHDPRLKEEHATSALAGVEWKPVAGRGQALFEVNLFHTRLTDAFHVVEQDDPSTEAVEMLKTNLGGSRVYGTEVNAGWGMGDDLVLQGGVVVQRARFDTAEPDFGTRDYFRTPQRYATASLRYNTHDGWQLFAGLRVTGPMRAPHYAGYIADRRVERTPTFSVIDVSISRRLALGDGALVISLNGRNLTNAYQRDLDVGPLRDATYVYGPRFPRSFGVQSRVEF